MIECFEQRAQSVALLLEIVERERTALLPDELAQGRQALDYHLALVQLPDVLADNLTMRRQKTIQISAIFRARGRMIKSGRYET